ncbi:hypothetical protein O0I10_010095 [Lichtheimia ornata]|uniref:Swi snf complex protein n=1 Tax=Lichtheimia ornata TaxID=688661 RepID=A0AAD7UVB4_9FUNG|nr:uncharacterized protein O0I10_010095 [Lichtheimia ornata]KAJ8654273.1 hypothetical protein O0I10_010095 [Lichtheimia ornata]
MATRNPKGAPIDPEFYEQPSTIDCFEDIRQALIEELQQKDIEARDLSLLTCQLQQFQQDHLGFNTKISHAPPRIPAKLFKLQPNVRESTESPLYTILLAAYTHRANHQWRKWDFAPSKKTKNVDLIQSIRDLLVQSGWIQVPKVAFSNTVPEAGRKSLMSMIKKMQLYHCEEEQEATHVLHGPLHQYEPGEEEWFRTLEKRDHNVLVHWWYYPDSYDSWLPQTDQFADPEEAPVHHGAWHIATRWLQDSVLFNELMNEEDYEELDEDEDEEEDEDDAAASTTARQTPASEDNNPPISIKTEQPAPEVPAAPLPILNPGHQPIVRIRDIEKERPQLGSRQRKNEFEPYSNGDITNISRYTASYIEFPPKEPSPKRHKADDPDLDAATAMPYDYNTLPMPEWFDENAIHQIEKVSFPEYFSVQGKKADKLAQDYIKYRNYMIDSYRKNPGYHLTISACKAGLGIDLVAVVRIHSFLEQAGIINQQVDPRRRTFDPIVESEPDAQITEKGSQRDFDAAVPDIDFMRKLIYEEKDSKPESQWDVEIYDNENPDHKTVFQCSTCKQDCSDVRYQSYKYKNYQLCTDCFLEGKFTANTWKGEFVRMEKPEPEESMEDDWTEEETLRLLDGIEQYDEDWLAISEHVGSRTKEQCITQFLQLPITDDFLSTKLSDKELEELPFGDQPNPIMTLIAYLSGHINPGVGSAAAKRAIKELIGENTDKDTQSDAMDIDDESAFTKEQIKKAAIGALESAVEEAKRLASYESEEIQNWTRLVTKTAVDKLMIKVQQYDEQETFLENELKELGKQSAALANSLEALTKQYPASTSSSAAVTPSASTPSNKQ